MIINHNLNAMNAHRQMGMNTVNSGKSMEKLSSGLRINRAGDDAAGLAISEKMRAQVRGLDQASRNAQDGISLIQTAEGALNETHSILQRMRELAVQSSNDTVVETDRDKIQAEVDQLSREITRISETTEFNTQKLLNGDFKDAKFHIGANQDQNVALTINSMDAKALHVTEGTFTATGIDSNHLKATNLTTGTVTLNVAVTTGAASAGTVVVSVSATGAVKITATVSSSAKTAKDALDALQASADVAKYVKFELGTAAGTAGSVAMTAVTSTSLTAATYSAADSKEGKGIKVNTQEAANTAITTINNAINTVSEERSKLGAMQNRLEHTITNLNTSSENLQASESRIRDVDMAKEMMAFSKNNILAQAAQAMLAQANQQPQGVLQLLR